MQHYQIYLPRPQHPLLFHLSQADGSFSSRLFATLWMCTVCIENLVNNWWHMYAAKSIENCDVIKIFKLEIK